MKFIADDGSKTQIEVPFFEDARADTAPYYAAEVSLVKAEEQVREGILKLGGGSIQIQAGIFVDEDTRQRDGYVIGFRMGGMPGILQVAGLPMRNSRTPKKVEQARKQALLNVAEWLRAAYTSMIFNPGGAPLVPFLLVDGERTVAHYMQQEGRLPDINPQLEPGVQRGEVIE